MGGLGDGTAYRGVGGGIMPYNRGQTTPNYIKYVFYIIKTLNFRLYIAYVSILFHILHEYTRLCISIHSLMYIMHIRI